MCPRPGAERDWGPLGPGPGRGGAVLYWPLPATRGQGIVIIAITPELYQAVVLTSLVCHYLTMTLDSLLIDGER